MKNEKWKIYENIHAVIYEIIGDKGTNGYFVQGDIPDCRLPPYSSCNSDLL